MEKAQKELLKQLEISLFDSRLRHIREKAKEFFEKSCFVAARKGLNLDEKTYAGIYTACFTEALGMKGIKVPDDMLPDNKQLTGLVREVMS